MDLLWRAALGIHDILEDGSQLTTPVLGGAAIAAIISEKLNHKKQKEGILLLSWKSEPRVSAVFLENMKKTVFTCRQMSVFTSI